jgi:hypothetical protein
MNCFLTTLCTNHLTLCQDTSFFEKVDVAISEQRFVDGLLFGIKEAALSGSCCTWVARLRNWGPSYWLSGVVFASLGKFRLGGFLRYGCSCFQ